MYRAAHMKPILVAALYKFSSLEDYAEMRAPILETCRREKIVGSLLLAREGINGTIAGSDQGVANVLAYLRADPRLSDLPHKESRSDELPFKRMKVRLKKEIVTMGIEDIDPNQIVGTYVAPNDWNDVISDPDVTVIDTRNHYEVGIGTFKGAIDPNIQTFREFPNWLYENDIVKPKKKVAMFCTGGIRCEKATAYLRQQGVKEVYHLSGGILKYLETVPPENSLWDGECFVFDDRVSVGHGLKPGSYDSCPGCGGPVGETEKASPLYERDVSCPTCSDTLTEEQRSRFRERRHQNDLKTETADSSA